MGRLDRDEPPGQGVRLSSYGRSVAVSACWLSDAPAVQCMQIKQHEPVSAS
jgi:hypothetical protein